MSLNSYLQGSVREL